MFLQRMNSVLPFGDFRREIDRLFDDFGAPLPGRGRSETFPAINLWEDSDSVYVEAELPGFKMSDIELTVVGNELSLRGERKAQSGEGTTYHRRERGAGAFTRFVQLPVTVEIGRVEAVLRDGVLTVTLPKAAQAKPRRIEVKTT